MVFFEYKGRRRIFIITYSNKPLDYLLFSPLSNRCLIGVWWTWLLPNMSSHYCTRYPVPSPSLRLLCSHSSRSRGRVGVALTHIADRCAHYSMKNGWWPLGFGFRSTIPEKAVQLHILYDIGADDCYWFDVHCWTIRVFHLPVEPVHQRLTSFLCMSIYRYPRHLRFSLLLHQSPACLPVDKHSSFLAINSTVHARYIYT